MLLWLFVSLADENDMRLAEIIEIPHDTMHNVMMNLWIERRCQWSVR